MIDWGQIPGRTPLVGAGTVSTATAFALSSAYTFGAAGRAVGSRIHPPRTTTLVDVYVYCDSVAGSLAGKTARLEIRNAASDTLPGGTLHASVTAIDVSSWTAGTWHKITLASPLSLTPGTPIWVIFAGENTDGVNNLSPLSRGPLQQAETAGMAGYTTSNGWTGSTAVAALPPLVLALGDGTYIGCPYTTRTAYTSNTLERGLKFTPDSECDLSGIRIANATANISGVKVYAGSTAPGGTTLRSVTIATGSAAVCLFDDVRLVRNTAYRVVLTFGAAETAPDYLEIADYATYAGVQAARMAGGALLDTIDNGAGDWTDTAARLCAIGLILRRLPATGVGRTPR